MVIICTTCFNSKELWILSREREREREIHFVNRVNLLVSMLGMQHVRLCVETEFLSLTCMNQVFERLYAIM